MEDEEYSDEEEDYEEDSEEEPEEEFENVEVVAAPNQKDSRND